MLLQQIEQHPETTGLKRLLAVKKSLLEFEQRVEFVVRVVQQLMTDNAVVEIFIKRKETFHIFHCCRIWLVCTLQSRAEPPRSTRKSSSYLTPTRPT